MSSSSSDRNLLCGILAWQNGLVSEAQLLAGMKQWIFDKQRPLEDVFHEAGLISEKQQQRLAEIVRLNTELNDDGAEESLQRLSSVVQLKTVLQHLGDDDVAQSLGRTFIASDSLSAEESTGPERVPETSSQRYQKIKPHARGGLGEVFVARDEELNREVALKEMLEEQASSQEGRNRFRLEAEITGGLEHPGIVPVYGLGSHPDGRPFYAMRFIRGENLRSAIRGYHSKHVGTAEATLRFRELLKRFVDVCNAVEYAHSRGILHRDLKPGNVMLGRYGETLVVDWGLAKVAGAESEPIEAATGPLVPRSEPDITPTQEGGIIGTLQYMSPEQASGQQDALGPTTDVYAMGAILYEILTNRPPIERVVDDSGHIDLPSTLRNIQRGQIVLPTQIEGTVSRPLEAVCLKALKPNPRDRYARVADLALDVERWLADEPVTAWREPASVRTRRWIQRHRTAVATTAAVALVSLVGLMAGVVLLSEKNAELEVARTNEQSARQEAEANFEDARQTVNRFLTEVTESPRLLLQEPGTQVVRRNLLNQAKDYYQQFIGTRGDDPALQKEIADAHLRLAEIEVQLSPSSDKAIEAYQTAIDLYDTTAEKSETSLLSLRIRAREGLAAVLREMGSYEEALSLYDEARNLLGEVSNDRELGYRRATVAYHTGLTYATQGAYEPSKNYFATAISEISSMQLETLDDEHKVVLAKAHMGLSKAQSLTGDTDSAMTAIQESLNLLQSVVADEPDNHINQIDLAIGHESLAGLHLQLGHIDEAVGRYEAAKAILKTLYEQNPYVTDFAERYSDLLVQLGQFHSRHNHPDEAKAAITTAIAIFDSLLEREPGIIDFQYRRSQAHVALGTQLGYAKDWKKAHETFENAIGQLRRLMAVDPSPKNEGSLAHAYMGHAMVYYRQGNLPETTAAFERAATHYEDLATEHSEVTDYAFNAASIRNNLGAIHSKQKEFTKALLAYEGALDAYRLLQSRNQDIVKVSFGIAATLGNMAYANDVSGDKQAAMKQHNEAIGILLDLLKDDPEHKDARRYLRNSYWGRAELYEELAQFEDAVDDWDSVLKYDDGDHKAEFMTYRARTIALAGDFDRAMAAAEETGALDNIMPEDFIGLAKLTAVCLDHAARDANLTASQKEDRRTRFSAFAVQCLNSAAEKEYFTTDTLSELDADEEFEPLRQTTAFETWRSEIQQTQDKGNKAKDPKPSEVTSG